MATAILKSAPACNADRPPADRVQTATYHHRAPAGHLQAGHPRTARTNGEHHVRSGVTLSSRPGARPFRSEHVGTIARSLAREHAPFFLCSGTTTVLRRRRPASVPRRPEHRCRDRIGIFPTCRYLPNPVKLTEAADVAWR